MRPAYAAATADFIDEGGILPPGLALASSSSASRFRYVKYVCHPTATTPAKILRYSMGINVKLTAVTAGQSLRLFLMLVGTVLVTLSQISAKLSPARKLCMPKKYVLKIGVKTVWFMMILVPRDKRRDE